MAMSHTPVDGGSMGETHMTGAWLVGVIVFATSSGIALAQNAPVAATSTTQPNMSTNGPAGTYDVTKVQRSLHSDGTVSATQQTFDKSQTYSSGHGTLRAHTIIRTSGPTTIEAPTSIVPQESTK